MATVDRAAALVGRIARLGSEPARREAVALGLVDALLERDHDTLSAALDSLRDARADADPELVGWLDAALAFAHWGLERTPSQAAVAQGTQAHEFLTALDGSSRLGSTELRRLLELDETQVSRTGRRLLESGLVIRRKVGRQAYWELTPRGERALEESPPPPRSNSDFWQEALSRGFDAVYGDEPGEPREVDPAREHIVACALELHTTKGIQATTLSDIADRAAVPIETLEALFPTLDDLARSCGRHLMESLALPPHDRAPEVFAGAASEHDRIHRLVETLFGAYERGGEGMAVGRRERRAAPAVEESVQELERTFDALIVEAVHPRRADVVSLRALTDLEVWRGLRHQGATPEAAVEEVSAAVERWLAAR
jgi:AcrR family transcriptional regulator